MADNKVHTFSIIVTDTGEGEFNVGVVFEGSKTQLSKGLLAAMQSEEKIRSMVAESLINDLSGNKIEIGKRIDLSRGN